MDMIQDERYHASKFDPGAAAVFIEHGNDDSIVKCGSPMIDTGDGDVDACKLTSTMIDIPTDLLNSLPVAGKSDDISVEESNRCIITAENGFTVSCKSDCLLTVSETDLSNVEKNDTEEKRDDNKVSGVENDQVGSNKGTKSLQSRERKKSKYLCPPFVNLGKESKVLPYLGDSEIEDSKSLVNASFVKCSKGRTESRKSTSVSVKFEDITAPSADLLMKLHSVALDHLNPYYDSVFDPAELFFNRFRASVFRGLPSSELVDTVDDKNDEEDASFDAHVEKQSKNPVRKEKGKKESNKKLRSGLYDVDVAFAPSPLPRGIKQRKRKRKEATISPPMGPPMGPSLDSNNGMPGEPGQKKRMRKKGTKPGIPYINGNNVKPISLEVCLQDAGPYVAPASTASTGPDPNDNSSDELTLDQMKHSLELMTSMLEKSAGTISPETRASLENEIKNLLKKVNPWFNSFSLVHSKII